MRRAIRAGSTEPENVAWCEADLGRILVRLMADPALEVARVIAIDLREPRRRAFVRRCQILLENLGKPGGDKFWSDDPGVG